MWMPDLDTTNGSQHLPGHSGTRQFGNEHGSISHCSLNSCTTIENARKSGLPVDFFIVHLTLFRNSVLMPYDAEADKAKVILKALEAVVQRLLQESISPTKGSNMPDFLLWVRMHAEENQKLGKEMKAGEIRSVLGIEERE